MLNSKKQLYGKPGLYRIFNQIPNRVKEKYGHTLCRELSNQWLDEWLCREHALTCRDMITDIAGMAAELALSDKDDLASLPLGANVENLKE